MFPTAHHILPNVLLSMCTGREQMGMGSKLQGGTMGKRRGVVLANWKGCESWDFPVWRKWEEIKASVVSLDKGTDSPQHP